MAVRNERNVQVSTKVTPEVNERVHALADALGQSKGTTISLCLSLGLDVLEKQLQATGGALALGERIA